MGSLKSSHLFPSSAKKTCLCAPTTRPGSFRCKFHRGSGTKPVRRVAAYHPGDQVVSLKDSSNLKVIKAKTMNDLLRQMIVKPLKVKLNPEMPRKDFRPTVSRFGDNIRDGNGAKDMIIVP